MDVAAEAVVANELDITLFAQLLVPNNDPVIPFVTPKLPDIANDPDVVNDPLKTTMSVVSSNDPVIVWVPLKELDPVVANTADDVLFNNCAFCANDAVDGVNVILVAAEAVVANDELTVNEDVCEKLAVVANDAVVIEPLNDPVLICRELEINVGLFTTLLYST